ncbi:TPA: ATP-binding protein [Candidatus Bathyarchaeota archaeon]|nr:ATP-binding protein [Candidatus Bathyarchaeota archaeon]
MKEYGSIIGQSDPTWFEFNISDPKNRPVSYEYVEVEVEEPQQDGSMRSIRVLGQVKKITSRHPFYDERTTPDAARKMGELGVDDDLIQVFAHTKVLGYLHNEGGRSDVRRPRSPPMPGSPVFRASDEILQRLFTLSEGEIPLMVGSLLHREGISVPVSGKELHRHTAILAMTRYGKSYFAGRIMEQLLKQGASILVIDAHGDYANMTQDPDGAEHEFFRDKVTVYHPEAAEAFDANHVKPLHIGASQCSVGELSRLAHITGSLQRIILNRAVKEAKTRKKLYGLQDIIDVLYAQIDEGEEETPEAKKEKKAKPDKVRVARVIEHLEGLAERNIFSDGELPVKEFFAPMHMSDVFLSGISDDEQDVLVGMILRRVFQIKYRHEEKLPLFVFVEEAHRFAAPPDEGGGRFSRDIIARIAAEGAKFGVFLTVISQRPRRIDPDILSNCSNLAILRVVNSTDQNTIQAASESFSEDLLADLPALEQGEAVLVGPFVPVPVMIKTARRETRHGGRTPEIADLLRQAREDAEIKKKRDAFPLH